MTTEERLEVIGGMYEATAEILSARTQGEVLSSFARAHREGFRLTISGARRSFGEQYLPTEGGKVLDVAGLDRGATLLAEEPDGSIWVRSGGGTTFKDLCLAFPRHRVSSPPTTDTITVSGALAACVHNSASYFADSVRAFVLLAPSGETFHCARGLPGLEGELFDHVPGSFGALGVVTDVELRLRPLDPDRWVLVHSLYAGPSTTGQYLDRLEEAADDPRFAEGAGAVIYGNRGHAITLGDELLPPGKRPTGSQALLTGEDIRWQSITQSLVHRFPRLAEWLVTRTYPQGAARWAPLQGFLYFQRGYDEAHRRMTAGGASKALLQLFGARGRLPICHTSWFFPRAELRSFVEGYFSILDRYPGLPAITEQQDIVLLGPSRWPCHSMGRTEGPIGILTASFAIERGGESARLAHEFCREVTRRCRDFSPGARVSLCKQVHAEETVLRSMHADFRATVHRLRARVDPARVLTSRLLAALGAD